MNPPEEDQSAGQESVHEEITGGDGPPIRITSGLSADRSKIRANAGVKGRWHDKRHTLITELAENGAGELSRTSPGHVSRQMMKHYSHIRMDPKRKALESIVVSKT